MSLARHESLVMNHVFFTRHFKVPGVGLTFCTFVQVKPTHI